MRHVILAIVLLFASVITYAHQAADTTAVKDTGIKQQPVPAANNQPDTAKQTTQPAAKNTADSTSLMLNLAHQQANPQLLYKKTHSWPLALAIGLLFIVGTGLWLLFNTSLCRDQSYDPCTNQLRPFKQRPFSYSKVQLLWWTLIVLSSFTIFYFYTYVLAAFTPTMVLLLGGGLAVSIFGKVIDNSQIQQNSNGVPTRHQDIAPTQGLMADILSDDSGISIHRFQSIIVNLIFGIAFIVGFFQATAAHLFPFMDFQNWQLTLLGISAGSYIGFKTNENSDATKEQRQVEAVKTAAAINATADPVTTPPPSRTAAFAKLQSNLYQKGLITEVH